MKRTFGANVEFSAAANAPKEVKRELSYEAISIWTSNCEDIFAVRMSEKGCDLLFQWPQVTFSDEP
jgi:hypothetical protein